jgi:hypothetical protein
MATLLNNYRWRESPTAVSIGAHVSGSSMNKPASLIQRTANIFLNKGTRSLLAQAVRSLTVRIRFRFQETAYAEIDRIAKSNISSSAKFSLIYRRRLWLKAMPHLNPDKTLSGHGSTVSSTKVLRQALENFLQETRPNRVFDAPCGDFNWMKDVNFPDDCDYIGGDIVPALVLSLQHKYSRATRAAPHEMRSRQFISFDLTTDAFPIADIWLCKDCLQHLSNSDISLVLDNFRRSQVKVALISTHIEVATNIDVKTGQFRHVDLTRAPFNLPPPRQILPDSPIGGEPRYVGVWYREDLC